MLFLLTIALILTIFLFSNKRYRLIYILYKTLPRDIRGGRRALKLFYNLIFSVKKGESVPKIFHKLAKKHPHRVAFYYEEHTMTYKQLDEFSNQTAQYFKSKGYAKGDTIALLLENRPEYVGLWLGLSKIGVVTALINTNLVAESLIHSLSASGIKALIYGSNFTKAVSEIKETIIHLQLFEYGDCDKNVTLGRTHESNNLKLEMKNHPKTVPEEMAATRASDKLVYIYTSGTTGMPKAAVILNSRYMLAAGAVYFMTDLSSNDILYNPLPLFHSSGGMLSAGQSLLYGIPVVLRNKFSASNYWKDCQKYRCTVANYIGEICRYLLAVHKPDAEVKHGVKKMIGNGLRPQIWQQFKDTFQIEEVCEFYGSTEGNSQMVNIDGTVGAVGFVPRFANFVYPSILIQCDENTGEPVRNKDGLCIKCNFNEPGLMVGKINQGQFHKAFVGYTDEKATRKKIFKDVLVKGDAYFNTGDVLIQDEFGYFYFKDRTGDSFRWKGENVATCEVEAVISGLLKFRDVISYGVQVPGTEGRASMAAIVDPDNTLDLKTFARGLKSKLPGYAVPLFLRIIDSVPITGTFKLKKVELQKDGFDLEKMGNNRMYFLDSKIGEYIRLTKEIYDDIVNGRVL